MDRIECIHLDELTLVFVNQCCSLPIAGENRMNEFNGYLIIGQYADDLHRIQSTRFIQQGCAIVGFTIDFDET